MAGVKQPFFGYTASGFSSGSGTAYLVPTGFNQQAQTTEAYATIKWEVNGDFRRLRVKLDTAPGSGHARIFDLLVNGVPSGLSVTISNTDTVGSDVLNTAFINAGDSLTLRASTSDLPTASGVSWTVEFNGRAAGEAGYGWIGVLGSSTAAAGLLQGNSGNTAAWPTNNQASQVSVIRIPGTAAVVDLELLDAPGTGKSRTFTLYRNGVADGTVSAVTISDSSTTGSFSSFAAAEDDELQIRATSSGSPTDTRVRCGVRYVGTSDGVSNFCGISTGMYLFGGVTEWILPSGGGWNSIEASALADGPISDLVLASFRIALSSTVATTTVAVRKNGSTTAMSVTLAGVLAGEYTAGTVTITAADNWNLQHTPTDFLEGPASSWGFSVTGSSEFVIPHYVPETEELCCAPSCGCDTPPTTTGGGAPPTGSPSETPLPSATGNILPPVSVLSWIPQCAGGGDVPTAADATDAESWVS